MPDPAPVHRMVRLVEQLARFLQRRCAAGRRSQPVCAGPAGQARRTCTARPQRCVSATYARTTAASARTIQSRSALSMVAMFLACGDAAVSAEWRSESFLLRALVGDSSMSSNGPVHRGGVNGSRDGSATIQRPAPDSRRIPSPVRKRLLVTPNARTESPQPTERAKVSSAAPTRDHRSSSDAGPARPKSGIPGFPAARAGPR